MVLGCNPTVVKTKMWWSFAGRKETTNFGGGVVAESGGVRMVRLFLAKRKG